MTQAYQGDMREIARDLTPTEAQMLCARLQAGGIPAETGDTQLVQAHSLISVAVGGAKVRVPEFFVDDAHALIAALNRGEFALDDDFDVGPPIHDN